MDLFGIKKRRARKEANARRRAEALENAIRIANEPPPAPPASTQGRRYRPPTRRPERYNDPIDPTYGPYGTGGVYPHSSRGMDVDFGNAFWAQPASDDGGSRSSHSSHDSLGAAGSGLDLGSSSYSGGSSSSYDSGSSSSSYDSGSSSSSSDSGGY